jgi:hypothetical protein
MPTSDFDPEDINSSAVDSALSYKAAGSSLDHQSPSQINEIYVRYLKGEKTADLIKEYDVKTTSNSLLKLLPPIERHDLLCPHCSSPAIQRRRPKTGAIPEPFCSGCSHAYESRGRWCGCDGCRHEYIAVLNGNPQQTPILYSELTFREKAILLSVLMLTKTWETSYFSFQHWNSKDPKLSPTPEHRLHCQRALFDRRIILIAEETSHDQLQLNRQYGIPDNLLWRPNISSDETSELLDIDELQTILSDDLVVSGASAIPPSLN